MHIDGLFDSAYLSRPASQQYVLYGLKQTVMTQTTTRTEEDPQLSGKVPSYEPGVGQITALCALSVTWNSAVLIHFLLDSFSFIYAGSPGVIAARP